MCAARPTLARPCRAARWARTPSATARGSPNCSASATAMYCTSSGSQRPLLMQPLRERKRDAASVRNTSRRGSRGRAAPNGRRWVCNTASAYANRVRRPTRRILEQREPARAPGHRSRLWCAVSDLLRELGGVRGRAARDGSRRTACSSRSSNASTELSHNGPALSLADATNGVRWPFAESWLRRTASARSCAASGTAPTSASTRPDSCRCRRMPSARRARPEPRDRAPACTAR